MRTCTKCRIAKLESNFFIRDKTTGRLHSQCKLCYKEQRKINYAKHYAKYRQQYLVRAKIRRDLVRNEFHVNMLDYLSTKACIICGENDIRVLEFDHLDPQDKQFTISQAVRLGRNWQEILIEMAKCQVLCSNCHKKRTATQYKWYKSE